jgi:hypothetical protein
MKATINIPDELFRKAKIAAVEQGKTFRELVCEALYQSLGESESVEKPDKTHHFRVDELGFVVYDPPFDRKPVTDDFVNRLREKFGI